MTVAPADKRPPGGGGAPPAAALALPRGVMGAFRAAYLPPGVDPADPRASVLRGDPSGFPEHVLILTAERDRLAPEAEALAGRLEDAGKKVVRKRFEGVGHGWDKTRGEGSEDARARGEAYDLVVKFLGDVRQ
jgi:acetyl esterase/lipase